MSLAHELRVLELPSQVELLDRLQLLTRFSSSLVNISGVKGSGKTWLAQRYLEAWAQEKNQALLYCHPAQTDAQRRTMLLSQIIPDPLFNQDDPLQDSFAYLMGEEACDIVMVIDDAHLLSETLLAELWLLMLEARQHPKWVVNVVLFGEGDALEHVLTRISYGQDNQPVDLEIEPLKEQEAQEFLELLVVKYAPTLEAKQKIRKQAKRCAPLPGALTELGTKKVEKRIIIRSVIESPARIAALVVCILLLTAGGYWWLLSQPEPGKATALEPETADELVMPDTVLNTGTEQQSDKETLVIPAPEQGSTSAVQDDALALPPGVIEETATVGSGDDGHKRVVVPSDVVDALMEDRTPPPSVQVIDDAVDDAAAQSQPQAEPKTLILETDALMALPSTGYTLQLAALTSPEETLAFIELHQLEGNVRVYTTPRNDQLWHIVTYRDYPTIQQARDAVEALPVELQAVGPWAKSLNQVQREILRAK